jgi:cyclic pyranopterin phosphate synthase
MSGLSHFDDRGASRMVDVGGKEVSQRMARASAVVRLQAETVSLIRDCKLTKGDVLEVARLAGIMAAKRTAELIPLCHALPLDSVAVEFDFVGENRIAISTMAKATARTGVEMEALVAASIAALTIYDMVKSVDRAVEVEQVRLEEKVGGKSGHYVRGPGG